MHCHDEAFYGTYPKVNDKFAECVIIILVCYRFYGWLIPWSVVWITTASISYSQYYEGVVEYRIQMFKTGTLVVATIN